MGRKNKGKTQQDADVEQEKSDTDDNTCNESERETMEAIQASIIAEIQTARAEVKKDFTEAMDVLRRELGDFRQEVGGKLNKVVADIKEVTERVAETEQRVADMEEACTENREALAHALQVQEKVLAQLTDLEARSRRNNIRIHGVPEGAEGDNIEDFIDKFIQTQLSLPNVALNIQRCHRSLGTKPPPGANPRSVLVYLQDFKTKDMVLRSAWKMKEILYEGKRVFFEQDYPTEVVMKRKAYSAIRKTLKEKGLRFQTLYPAKLRVFFDTGPIVYNSASHAREELRKRGVIADSTGGGEETPADAAPSLGKSHRPWKTAGTGSRRGHEARMANIREKLRSFRHGEGV